MKLHLTEPAGSQLITGYGDGWVEVNQTRHDRSVVVLPAQLFTAWQVDAFDSLTEAHFRQLVDLSPELVLLGTGTRHHFVHPRLSRALTEAGIGLECMDTPAACRTYNILMSEGRHVAAALIVQGNSPG